VSRVRRDEVAAIQERARAAWKPPKEREAVGALI
jgi:hypothetical protein